LIETSLVQNGCIDDQDPADIFTPLFASVNTYDYSSLDFVNMLSERNNVQISDYQTYLDLLGNYMIGCKQNGAVGFKIAAGQYVEPDMEKACQSFGEVLNGAKPEKELIGTTLDYIFEKCVELDWPVAVHCGIWWDYRTVDSKPMIDIVTRYPEVRFDLYHLGMPFVRDTIFIAKNFPNAYLNLCWTYIISQSITEQAIQEIIDTVPVNKIFAFGGDSCWSVESVYGHLKMARQTLAKALSERVENELLDLDGARHILKLWMYDNPVAFYRL
jgi:predicted TIM-barrel fold metal-dependent hydrolase